MSHRFPGVRFLVKHHLLPVHVISRIAAIHRRRGEYEPALRLLHKILDDLPAEDSLQKYLRNSIFLLSLL